jgi:hypothetical protein
MYAAGLNRAIRGEGLGDFKRPCRSDSPETSTRFLIFSYVRPWFRVGAGYRPRKSPGQRTGASFSTEAIWKCVSSDLVPRAALIACLGSVCRLKQKPRRYARGLANAGGGWGAGGFGVRQPDERRVGFSFRLKARRSALLASRRLMKITLRGPSHTSMSRPSNNCRAFSITS